MQVAGHVLWPRAAWLYHGATFLMTQSFLVSGGLVSKLTMDIKNLCSMIYLSKFLVEHETNFGNPERIQILLTKSMQA